MGTVTNLAATASTKSGGSSYSFILIILVIFVAFYFLMIRPNQRRRQQQVQQQSNLGPGARVRTTAGMYATVVAVDGDDVVLEVAPGIEVRYMKRSIMDVVSAGASPEDTYEADAEDPDGDAETPDAEAEHVEHTQDDEVADDTELTAYEKATGTKKD
jgi:preprotein translocase subunit YajC